MDLFHTSVLLRIALDVLKAELPVSLGRILRSSLYSAL